MLKPLRGIFAGLLLTALPTLAMAGYGPSITLYSEPDFRGESITIRQDISNFSRLPPWNDRARSLVVNGGTWEVCKHKNFDKCRTLAPGARIGHLGEIKYLGEISSVRVLQGHAGRDPRWDDDHWDDGRWDDGRWDDGRWDRWPRNPPPTHRPPPRWDDDVVWDDPWDRPSKPGRLSACQQTVYDGFVDRYRYRAPVQFSGTPRDGVIWWDGEPWRYRCGHDRINIWQESRW